MRITLEEAARRYTAGDNVAKIAAAYGRTERILRKHLRRAGVAILSRGPRRRWPRERRPCHRDGCTRTFEVLLSPHRPPQKFCSAACRRKHPPPTPRPCEHCGELFTPEPRKIALGTGRFCSYRCWNRWRTGRPQREWRPRAIRNEVSRPQEATRDSEPSEIRRVPANVRPAEAG